MEFKEAAPQISVPKATIDSFAARKPFEKEVTMNPILENVLTHSEPLGPIDQSKMLDDAAENLLDEKVNPFREVNGREYMVLFGRKGAGKSAILTGIRLKKHKTRRDFAVPDSLPAKEEPYFVPVMSWEHFHQIVKNVANQYHVNDLLSDIVPTEFYSKLWYETLWDEIIQHFFNYTHFKDAREDLGPVNSYMNGDTSLHGTAEHAARRLFEDARISILKFLDKRQSRLYFLFDSMENYPVRNTVFARTLTGLFQALSSISYESKYIKISFCIPEELEAFLTGSSATLLKDFASSYRIRWRPIDLLRITAHRLRLFLEIHDKEFHRDIVDLDFSRREHIHLIFSRLLPPAVHNGVGAPEDPLAYIIRHTQLLPRHVLATFNAILSRNYFERGGFRQVGESAIRDGVTHMQRILATQILHPYDRVYPKLIAACRVILPDLKPVCSFKDLKKVESRFKQRIEEDIISVWDTLFQIGIIGRSVAAPSSAHASSVHGDRYCYGQFHFNTDKAFGMATDGEYCFHPVFSREFGIARRNDPRVVYPANVDMVTLKGGAEYV